MPEDRNCCNCSNNTMNSEDIMTSSNLCPRQEMLNAIKSYRFAVIELGLYLDTHSNDTRALCLHRQYANELKDLCDKYQKVYGPLTIEYPCNKWRWLEGPWPWEGGNI